MQLTQAATIDEFSWFYTQNHDAGMSTTTHYSQGLRRNDIKKRKDKYKHTVERWNLKLETFRYSFISNVLPNTMYSNVMLVPVFCSLFLNVRNDDSATTMTYTVDRKQVKLTLLTFFEI